MKSNSTELGWLSSVPAFAGMTSGRVWSSAKCRQITAIGLCFLAPPALALDADDRLPLTDVLAIAKPYPNLVNQIRLELVRAGATMDKIVCTGRLLPADWPALGGKRIAPYDCAIGRRTLHVTAQAQYYDRNGHRLEPGAPGLSAKAAKVVETRLTWRWR